MKIAVMGAGAVGCYYGGMLARAGHEVVLIGRPQHVDAINRDGLRFTKGDFDGYLRIAASTEAAAAQGARLVLFCVKSTDTETAGAGLKPFLPADALLLTLQNGVDNADRLRTVVPQEVAAAVVYVASEMAGVGHVRHQGRGELVIEPSSASDEIARMLIDADIPTEVSDNVRGSLWAKLILNCAYNAMSAISQLPYGRLVQCEGVPDVMRDVVAECFAVAHADGVTVPGDATAAVHRIAETMPAQYSSTAQDVARRRRSEIDHLNGYVMRRGEARGVPTPVNRVLHTLVKAIETKQSA
ncbi:ketopantoate reductase family protein [Paraburkholderia phosphatilytica]|uniref:ketopantoate reductase family protein n=1 Tax=Paraburkholderia phosphatilytica TaxID=2282883 RepID=UPI000E4B83D5|nr:ketopantoate reductase family protein [Paraburkholderia phosphatilytica]